MSKTENKSLRAQDEPSMEEILASIRRIISQEGGGEEGEDEGQGAEKETAENEDQIFDAAPQTKRPSEDMASSSKPKDPPPVGQQKLDRGSNDMQEDDVLLLTQMLDDDGAVIDLSEKKGFSELISVQAARQSSEAFAALANVLVRENMHKERTLEDLIKDIMRPLLKEWLDNHLSDMVERMVQDEIEKIAGRTRH